jgi:hypothetical protein
MDDQITLYMDVDYLMLRRISPRDLANEYPVVYIPRDHRNEDASDRPANA